MESWHQIQEVKFHVFLDVKVEFCLLTQWQQKNPQNNLFYRPKFFIFEKLL